MLPVRGLLDPRPAMECTAVRDRLGTVRGVGRWDRPSRIPGHSSRCICNWPRGQVCPREEPRIFIGGSERARKARPADAFTPGRRRGTPGDDPEPGRGGRYVEVDTVRGLSSRRAAPDVACYGCVHPAVIL